MVAFLEVGFFPRVHTAIAEWLACMLFILPQKKRFGETSWQQIGCCIGFLALLLGLNLLNQEQSGLTWMLLMAACMGTMLAMIVCCCKLKLMKAGYIWAHAFITAEFAASLEWQINYYLLMADSVDSRGTWLVMAGTYIIVFSAIYLLNQKHHILRSGTSVTRQELISGSAIALASFCLSNFNFAFTNNVFTETLGTGIIYSRTLVDFGGVIMLFAYDMARSELYLSHELEAMENLLNRQYEQYRQFEANNKAMHQIYHDLKHQIDFIRNEKSASKRESYLAEMEKVVTLRDAEMNTGNAILDTVLTSKSLRCAEEGIVMTCFADAHDMGFIDMMDICSIFGNAIDNAIECVEKIADKNMRLIKLTVRTQNRFLLIRVENCTDKAIDLNGGQPATTKENKESHGYGIKSIRKAAEKYGGCMTLEQQDGWFIMTVLIPLAEEKKRVLHGKLGGQLAIGQKFRTVFPFSAPRTEMNFINARRTVKAVISFAILHPLPVIPLVVVEVINDRRRLRAYFGIKCHRVAFRQNIAFLRFNFILIEFALADIRNKDIPYAAVVMFAHNVDAAVPVVKCTNNRYPFRVRRPNRKADAFHPVDFHQVCTQFFIKVQMVAFRKQILVYIAQNRRE